MNDNADGRTKSRYNYINPFTISFFVAASLRILLFLSNPPANTFDDHFEPIYLIMKTGKIPAKNACFQCYHPPVFYGISAFIGKIVLALGIDKFYLPKILQSLCCLYGILHLGVVYLILRKVSLSSFSKNVAFATACFLPQHIYISAMNSNDTFSYVSVAVCVYLFLIAIERKLSIPWLISLSIAVTVTLFTKYTALVILPAIIIPFIIMLLRRVIVPVKKAIISMAIVLLLPLTCLGLYINSNIRDYGIPLPWNTAILNPALTQAKAEKIDLFDFKPWIAIKREVIYPEFLGSFWTLLYSRMWFDVEPKFLCFTDDTSGIWWRHYFGWLRGEEPFPTNAVKFSLLTRFTGSGLIALGMIPLCIVFVGIIRIMFGKWNVWSKHIDMENITMQIFLTLLFWNLAGVIAISLKTPVFSASKAIYILSSLPALAVLLGAGVMPFEKYKIAKRILGCFSVVLPALVVVHILHIVISAGFLRL